MYYVDKVREKHIIYRMGRHVSGVLIHYIAMWGKQPIKLKH